MRAEDSTKAVATKSLERPSRPIYIHRDEGILSWVANFKQWSDQRSLGSAYVVASLASHR